MARMILKKMTLENFKGVKAFTMDFDSERTDIKGANATGKTTLVDAFCWVLWNKDSNDNAPGSDAFHEKPLDSEGHEVHYLDTMVELICTLDGAPLTLKRVQRENWTTKRGFALAVYGGNESTYWINGVETKLKEFQARVAAIAPSDVFKLIGKLGAFNAMKWQDRRTALMKMADSDVDAKLLEQVAFKGLKEAVTARGVSVEDFRKILASERKLMNDELKMLPVRIDEAKKLAADATPEQINDAEYMMADAQKGIENVSCLIADLKVQSAENATKRQIAELELKAKEIKAEMFEKVSRAAAELNKRISEAQHNKFNAQAYRDKAERSLRMAEDKVASATRERERLLAEFAKAKGMPLEVEDICPTCGRMLDSEQIEKAKAELAEKRQNRMNEIRTEGKAAADALNKAQTEAECKKTELNDAEIQLAKAEANVRAVTDELQKSPIAPNFNENSELTNILAKIDELNSDTVAAPDAKIRELEARKAELQGNFNRAAERLATYRAVEAAKNRVRELEIERESKGAQLAANEKLTDLAERFVRERCGALEESINSKFGGIRWKLFDIQINGGLADCCTCMIPCDSGLVSYESANTASQINADISIVKTMSDYYEVKLPLFVDNAERINRIADAGTQMITLSVSTDMKLTQEA